MALLLFNIGFAQTENLRIRLTSGDKNNPLEYAHFAYGNQKGSSDAQGMISLRFEAGTKLEISHLNTGYQVFSAQQLEEASTSGSLHIPATAVNLQPVTVMALRPQKAGQETMQVGLQEQLAHDAGTYLLMNPAISGIRKSGAAASDPVLRGFKYEQLTIVTDGACASTAACPNRMDPPSSQVSLNMTEKVEVFKGPFALRYGNSFGGTINFVSMAPVFTDKLKPLARVTAGYESNGSVFRTEAMAGLSSKLVNWQLFGSLSQGNDYTDGNGTKVPGDFYRNSLGTTLALKLSAQQEAKISVMHNYAKDVDFPSLPMDLRTDDAWQLQAKHQIRFDATALKEINTSIYASLVDHFMDNRLKPLNPRTMNAETPANTRNIGGRSEATFQKGVAQLFAGLDMRMEEAEGTRRREILTGPMAGKVFTDNAWQHGQIMKTSAFAEYQRRFSDWALVLATRLELNQADVKDPDAAFLEVYPSVAKTQVNPSLSAGLTRYWNSSLSGSLWLGRAQRSGSLTERYINFLAVGLDAFEMVGNPAIKPEVNNQADLGLNYRHAGTTLSINVFVAYLQDYISAVKDTTLHVKLPTSPGVRRFVNFGEALMTGFEAGFQQQLPAQLTAQLTMAYTYGQDLESDQPLPEIPPFDLRLSLEGSYFKNKLKPAINLRYVSSQQRVSEAFGEGTTPGFMLLDASIDYQFPLGFRMKAGVKNLLDVAYYEHLSRAFSGKPDMPLYAPGRNIYLSLNYTLP